MTITLAGSNHGVQTSIGVKSLTVTVTISGTDKLLIAGGLVTGVTGNPGGISASANGVGPTGTIFEMVTNSYYRSFMFYWLASADGSTNIAISWPNQGKAWMCVSIWNGVRQSSPLGTIKTGSSLALTGITCDIGNMIVDLLTGNEDARVGTKDANWTLLGQNYLATSEAYGNGNMSYRLAASSSESSTWTGLANVQLHNAIPLKPAFSGSVIMF